MIAAPREFGRCLVIGGSGMLGFEIVRQAVAADIEARVLDLAPPPERVCDFAQGDMCRRSDLERAFAPLVELDRMGDRAGLADEDRPAGSFMFLGPTGVGKTELARALAEFMFNDEKSLIRIDMSEYMERHAVARLIGSPPGYVGHDEGGQLTELVRHRPYSLILFDEIEKAHPEVFNILLQMLDNGRLTDGKGKQVNFKNAIIIMTSNVGSEYFREMSGVGFTAADEEEFQLKEEQFREKVMTALRDTFKPEFLNRLDETIIFNALSPKEMERIVDIQLRRVEARLKTKGITLNITPEVRKYLVMRGFDPDYGARPVKRLIEKTIVDALADRMVRGTVNNGKKLTVALTKSNDVAISG